MSAVQEVPADFLASVGQAVVTPSQVSARSHSPAAARQTAPAGLSASGGHVSLDPVHVSAGSHAPVEARHVVAAVANVHVAVQQEPDWPFWAPRSHCSPESTWPSPQAARKVAMDAAQLRDGFNMPPAE